MEAFFHFQLSEQQLKNYSLNVIYYDTLVPYITNSDHKHLRGWRGSCLKFSLIFGQTSSPIPLIDFCCVNFEARVVMLQIL